MWRKSMRFPLQICTIPLQQGKVYTPLTSLRTAPSMSWWAAHKRDPGWSQPDSARSRALSRNALRLEIPFKGVECKRLKRKTSCISWSTKNKTSNTQRSWRTLWILFQNLKLSEGPVINLATSSSLVMEALWIWTTGQPKPITNKVSQIYHLWCKPWWNHPRDFSQLQDLMHPQKLRLHYPSPLALNFFTRATSLACASIDRFVWITPIPPQETKGTWRMGDVCVYDKYGETMRDIWETL